MKFFETSKYHTLKKSTYISLRWIGIIGQLLSINIVYFYFGFDFNFILSNIVIFIGALSNLFLIFIYQKTQLSDRSALIFLLIDILQLSILIYLTGGVINPFVIFLLIPSVFASSNLGLRTNLFLVLTTIFVIIYYVDIIIVWKWIYISGYWITPITCGRWSSVVPDYYFISII